MWGGVGGGEGKNEENGSRTKRRTSRSRKEY